MVPLGEVDQRVSLPSFFGDDMTDRIDTSIGNPADPKTRDDFRLEFQTIDSVLGRIGVLYDAACSKLWKKCKGKLAIDEDRCIAGLIMDLSGVTWRSVGYGETWYPEFEESEFIKKIFVAENPDVILKPGRINDIMSQGDSFPWEPIIGFNPFMATVAHHFDEGFCNVVSLNDETDMGLCQIAEVAKDWWNMPTRTTGEYVDIPQPHEPAGLDMEPAL